MNPTLDWTARPAPFDAAPDPEERLQDLSHDLRSPLAAAEGYLCYLMGGEAGELNDGQRDALETALRSLRRLQSFIDESLEEARTGYREGGMREGNVVPVVQDVMEMFRLMARGKQVTLTGRLETCEARVVMDEGRIRRVLTNLVGNALKFTPAGGTVSVSLASRGGRVTVFVADTGCGIPNDALGSLCERFMRAPQAELSGVPGTGLGLSIVRQILEEHGGELWVDSQPGVGSTFAFALPQTAVNEGVAS
ncbi:MAG: HAMP domain-containing histidine kinase [Elusimicrobia bacterium]|nr:HAMP domain-containing histidine kinase [Elusimicrobiota bacterium]